MKRKILLITPLLIASLLILPATSLFVFAKAPQSSSLATSLARRYTKIRLLANYPDPTSYISLDVTEQAFIMHGWQTSEDLPTWSEMTSQQKREYVTSASFTLKVNGVLVHLQRNQWYDHECDGMIVMFWAVFPANYFEYEDVLESYWSVTLDGNLLEHSETAEIVQP